MFWPPSELALGEAYIYDDFDSASVYGFHIGRHNVYQAPLAKPNQGDSRLPLTRADWTT